VIIHPTCSKSCLAAAHSNASSFACLAAGSANYGQLIVIFMHNIASGHEKTMRPAGPNNTDPGCWQQFTQQCRLVTDMTFDEARFEWHDINRNAAALIADTLSKVAASQADKPQG